MKASLTNYRQSPRKVRIVADMVRGKTVSRALAELSFLPKNAASAIKKLIASAAANAENNFKVSPDTLIVKDITVNKGVVLKRSMPKWRGTAHPIHKHSSHVDVTLGQK